MSLWSRFQKGLERTRERLSGQIGSLLGRRGPVDPATLGRLEEALLEADVGPDTTDWLLDRARTRLGREPELDLRTALERSVVELLGAPVRFEPGSERPWVALLCGVNGVGKTTLAGKLAAHFSRAGQGALLVAADTFRAAASKQLEIWAERAEVEIVRSRGDGGASQADPAAVVHDGLTAALARKTAVVLVDTAGRLHTKRNLMAELEKMSRVCARLVPGAPHHTLLVLDATLGQNGIQQAREFQIALPITSLALTKLDGTARGGAVLAIVHQLKVPISVVGLGEGIDDWQPFDPEAFASGLFG